MRLAQIKEHMKDILYCVTELQKEEPIAHFEYKLIVDTLKERVDNFGNELVDELTTNESTNNSNNRPTGFRMTKAQRDRLWELCGRYDVPFREDDYSIMGGLSSPAGWVEGWVGGRDYNGDAGRNRRTLYVGVSPEGESHS